MNINLPIYTIPSTIIYYDSNIERNIAYIYGLSTNIDTGYVDIIKFAAGKYNTQYEPLFEFIYEDAQRSGDPFLNHYPYGNSFIEKTNVYCIAYDNDNPNLYYYHYINENSEITSGWTTDKNKALYFFIINNAISNKVDTNNIIVNHNYIIKNLVNDGLVFPASSFIIDNFKDYYKEELISTFVSGHYLSATNPSGTGTLSINHIKTEKPILNSAGEEQLIGTYISGDQLLFGTESNLSPKPDIKKSLMHINLGINNKVTGLLTIAHGKGNIAGGNYSIATGYKTVTNGDDAIAHGECTSALFNKSHSEGSYTLASAEGSHTEGNATSSYGGWSHTEGYGTATYRNFSHAEGYKTSTKDESSHAEGNKTIASGIAAHAEGLATHTYGDSAHAEGLFTSAYLSGSHAEGKYTIASGIYSHVEGLQTKTLAEASHAEGYNTIAAESYQHVEGRWNQVLTGYQHIVGGGTSEGYRKNIQTLDWSGNQLNAGDISATINGQVISMSQLLERIIVLEQELNK